MKITKSTTLIEALNAAGISRSEMAHHCSDLYVFVTPITTAVINEWFEVQGLAKDLFVSVFKDQITGRRMYDVAFQYYKEEN